MNAIGRWLRNHPRLLEILYRIARRNFLWARPLLARIGYARADRWLRWSEEVGKKITFDCRMCGQCILSETGLSCPMNCPKELRNGPCGGVRPDGGCEIKPDMPCVWVLAWEGNKRFASSDYPIQVVQPAVDFRRFGRSAWLREIRQRADESRRGAA